MIHSVYSWEIIAIFIIGFFFLLLLLLLLLLPLYCSLFGWKKGHIRIFIIAVIKEPQPLWKMIFRLDLCRHWRGASQVNGGLNLLWLCAPPPSQSCKHHRRNRRHNNNNNNKRKKNQIKTKKKKKRFFLLKKKERKKTNLQISTNEKK